MSQKVKFHQTDRSFHALLKVRVNRYFDENRLSRFADGRMVLKTLFWFSAFGASFALYLSGALPVVGVLLCAVVSGFAIAALGFNVGHDAIHGAYSSRPWVNRALSLTFDLFGASSYTWSVAHNFQHHTFTNVPDADTDLDPGPWMRFAPGRRVYWFHRFQHVYMFALYTLTSLVWTFKKDWVQIIERDPRTQKHAPLSRVLGMIAGKLVHFGLLLGLPALLTSYSLWTVALYYVTTLMVCGLTLALVFQLAHVVEGLVYPLPDEEGVLHSGWAEHQLRTTANFAPAGRLATFVTGGLNHQVEHHLFAGICHVHYPALSEIVRRTAAEFNVPYHANETFWAALASHVRVMRALGRAPQPVPSSLVDEDAALLVTESAAA